MSAASIEGGPGQLTLATPGDWFAIRLPGPRSDLGTLIAGAVAAHPELGGYRRTLEAMVRDLADAAGSLNVAAAYATIFEVAGGLMPASLIVAVRSMEGMSLEGLAAEAGQLRDQGLPAPKIEMYDLPAGVTLRIERLSSDQDDANEDRDSGSVLLIVQYVAAAPGGQVLMLTFATPAIALTGHLRTLFHRIACTVQFEGQEPGR